jgi:hypothetical protein
MQYNKKDLFLKDLICITNPLPPKGERSLRSRGGKKQK